MNTTGGAAPGRKSKVASILNNRATADPAIIERRGRLEDAAKNAYAVFAHRAGTDVPFEHLPPQSMEAWREVVEYLSLDDSSCLGCGEPLMCVNCDAEALVGVIANALVPDAKIDVLVRR